MLREIANTLSPLDLMSLLPFLGSLLPGALVNVKVGKILADGLVISFLTYFHGTIDLFHLSKVGSTFHLST